MGPAGANSTVPGPPGVTGAQGPIGATGPTGATGPQGPWGPVIIPASWLAGANPNNVTFFTASRALTITSLVGVVEIPNSIAATVSVVKATNGTPAGSGTVIHNGSFDANGTASTSQTLPLTVTTMSTGDRLDLITTGTFTASIASISVTVQ
jgi:hypothetical protein